MPGLTYTIAELLKEQGRSRADALREQAKLRAEAQRASGSGWANAVAGAGQYIASIPAQKQQAQKQAAAAELEALKAQDLRGEIADKEKARKRSDAFDAVLNSHENIDDAIKDPKLMAADPARYADLKQHVSQAQKAADDERARRENFIASTLGSARDQGTWTKARYTVGRAYPNEVQDLPEDFEEAKPIVQSKLLAALPPKEQLDQMQKEQIPKGFTNETQLYAAAADPTHPQHEVAKAAIDMKRERPDKAETRSLDVQAADALARGDTETYKRLLKVKKEMGQADDRPPVTVRMGNGMTPGQAFAATRQLRNDYTRETSAARTVQQQLSLMKSSLDAVKKGSAAAGSQGVLVTFQKILDPTSVVRESEYARSGAGLSLLSRLEGQWMQIQQGGAKVPVSELEKFVTLAESFARNQKAFADQSREQVNAIASEYGLKPDQITRDVDPGSTPTAPPAVKKNPFRK